MTKKNTAKTSRNHLLTIVFSVLIALLLTQYEPFHQFISQLSTWGYIGIFIAGFFFSSSLTFATATVVLLLFGEVYSPVVVGIIGGLGAMVADGLIIKFLDNNLRPEVEALLTKWRKKPWGWLIRTKYFRSLMPVLGALIIASPFPDEIGLALFGLSGYHISLFLAISFILNAIGIGLIAYGGSLLAL